ncbi:HK97-gp10 family putative phage morphogenesis protein [Paraburkholderia sediminicola]|uniref:HK97-gp10 family putative phage morphogenesis protein n=1 Tax=Paraburkholderia sediminicola TaxID=458836 RepID=UPI001FE3F6A6|nr:HK97-gp10 family putative phage morphogenesis protein [Paraburkholderia sediminicola]
MARKPFEVANPDALTAQLRALDDAMGESTLRQAAVAGARIILDEMELRIPVASGKGKTSLLIAYDKEVSVTGKIASYIVTWSKEAFYLRFVEYGTSHSAANPFMRPAFEAKKNAAAEAVRQVIDEKLKAANGK